MEQRPGRRCHRRFVRAHRQRALGRARRDALVSGNGTVAMAVTTSGATQIAMGSREDGSELLHSSWWRPRPRVTRRPRRRRAASRRGQATRAPHSTGPTTPRPTSPATGSTAACRRRVADLAGGRCGGSAWSDTGLQNGTAYEYRVTAFDSADNESIPSTAAEPATPAPTPRLPPPDPAVARFRRGPPSTTRGSPRRGRSTASTSSYRRRRLLRLVRRRRRRRPHQAMDYGKFGVGIASWFGTGTHRRARGSHCCSIVHGRSGRSLKWSLYYEPEGYSNPSVPRSARTSLHQGRLRGPARVRQGRWQARALRLQRERHHVRGGRPLGAGDAGTMVCRHEGVPGVRELRVAAAAWHQYGPASAVQSHDKSFVISPGFWRADEARRDWPATRPPGATVCGRWSPRVSPGSS